MRVYEVDTYSPTSAVLFTLTLLAPDEETAKTMALGHYDMDILVVGDVRVVAEPGEAVVLSHRSGMREPWASQ